MASDKHVREEESMRVMRVVDDELQAEESSSSGSAGKLPTVQTFSV